MPAETGPTRATMTDSEAALEARRIISDFATTYRDQTPVPRYGPTPPVAQPGVPPMSQRATDATRLIMYSSLATVPPGLVAVAVMVASEHADPTVIGMICAAPAFIAVPILAVARLLCRAGEVAPDEIHNHYSGDVYQDQRNVQNKNSGVWVKNTND